MAQLKTLKFNDNVLNVSSSYSVGGNTFNFTNVKVGNTIFADNGTRTYLMNGANGEKQLALQTANCGYNKVEIGTNGDGYLTFNADDANGTDVTTIRANNGNMEFCDNCGNVGIKMIKSDGNWSISANGVYFGRNSYGYDGLWDSESPSCEPAVEIGCGVVNNLRLMGIYSLIVGDGGSIYVDANGFLKASGFN